MKELYILATVHCTIIYKLLLNKLQYHVKKKITQNFDPYSSYPLYVIGLQYPCDIRSVSTMQTSDE